MKKLDLNGQSFGELNVLSPAKNKGGRTAWICKCSCGNKKVLTTKSLRDGTKTCGECNKLKVGERINQLTILKTGIKRDSKYYAKCLCSCGKKKEILAHHTRYGDIKSCGCLNYNEDGALLKLYGDYKSKAKSRGYSFNLEFKYFLKISKMDCSYCGEPPSQIAKGWIGRNAPPRKYNGLDRINNKIGYEKRNVVSSCGKCNSMKSSLNRGEFLRQVKKILDNLNER